MTTADYRWLAYDLRTNVLREELPLTVKSYGGVLGGFGEFNATLPLTAETATLYTAATIPERTVIYVERRGVILDGYIIWQRRRALEAPMVLAGASLGSIFRRERIVSTLTYSGATDDQFTIFRGLLANVTAQPGGDFGIVPGSSLSGVKRDRAYNGYERKNAGDAMTELASVDNGFDWAIDCQWDAAQTAPQRLLTLSYPRRGRIQGTTGVVFASSKNIVDYEFFEDGTRSARSVDAVGAGDGLAMLISTSTDTTLIDAGYPLTSDVVSYKDISVPATLAAHAVADRRDRSTTPTFLTLTVNPDDVDAGLGTWIVGDDALVQITDLNFPVRADGSPGYQAYHRIIGYKVDVPDAGPEQLTVTLGLITS